MRHDLGVIDRGQHCAGQGKSYEDLDHDADIATPGKYQQDCGQGGN
jgi:hypothetical protein